MEHSLTSNSYVLILRHSFLRHSTYAYLPGLNRIPTASHRRKRTICANCLKKRRSHVDQRLFLGEPLQRKRKLIAGPPIRSLASSKEGASRKIRGPIDEYEDRVRSGKLKDDQHQRGKKPPPRSSLRRINVLFRNRPFPTRPPHHAQVLHTPNHQAPSAA